MSHQTILVLDFGSQYTQLIARRLRELSVYSEILPFNTPLEVIRERRPVGIILSGGPKSVSEADAPKCDPRVLELGLPTLGICYGMQLMTDVLGGRVSPAPHREFGHALVRREEAIEIEGTITDVLPSTTFRVALDGGQSVMATLCGKMRRFRIRVLNGDRVRIAMSPYDLSRGRITFRHKT